MPPLIKTHHPTPPPPPPHTHTHTHTPISLCLTSLRKIRLACLQYPWISLVKTFVLYHVLPEYVIHFAYSQLQIFCKKARIALTFFFKTCSLLHLTPIG